MNPQSSPAEGVNFPMLVPTFQLGHMSNLVYISDAVMVEGGPLSHFVAEIIRSGAMENSAWALRLLTGECSICSYQYNSLPSEPPLLHIATIHVHSENVKIKHLQVAFAGLLFPSVPSPISLRIHATGCIRIPGAGSPEVCHHRLHHIRCVIQGLGVVPHAQHRHADGPETRGAGAAGSLEMDQAGRNDGVPTQNVLVNPNMPQASQASHFQSHWGPHNITSPTISTKKGPNLWVVWITVPCSELPWKQPPFHYPFPTLKRGFSTAVVLLRNCLCTPFTSHVWGCNQRTAIGMPEDRIMATQISL